MHGLMSPHRSTLAMPSRSRSRANLLTVGGAAGHGTMDPEPSSSDTWQVHVPVTATSSRFGAHGPGPAGNRVTPASPLSPPMKGKQKLLSPSLPKRHQNSPLGKILKILRLENSTRFGAIHHLFTRRSRAPPFVRG